MEMFFLPFRLDLSSEQLWRKEDPISLRPKTFAVLRYLVEHSGKLVTKNALLDSVWAGTVVNDTVLKSCIRELRTALGDAAQTPQYIATVHRRGYRFLPTITTTPPVVSCQFSVLSGEEETRGWRLETSPLSPPVSSLKSLASTVVGREAELTQLPAWLDKALHGERQVVFVTGEAGIGKTTLVDVFLQTLTPSPQHPAPFSWLGRGQCIEQYGAGEAYMPILEALGRLCREPGGERLIALLNQHAPAWLVQMPTLLTATELDVLQRKVQGTTRERMLREMADALDTITAERPLVLWLEDLHWSDVSTLELLALLARRREPARLLVIGTYRPVDVIVKDHPLKTVKQELHLYGQCHELAVRLLSEEAVEEYLEARVPPGATDQSPLQRLAHAIHQRTEGNPLFMVNVVDELLAQGKIDNTAVESSTPVTIRQMIEQHLERLNAEEQRVLEVASVAGMEFSAAAVAAGAEATVDDIELHCTALARRGQFLQTKDTAAWPDGTAVVRYGFLHALYQEVIYERISTGRCVMLHQRIGAREEIAYGKQAGEIAAELAVHFERGHDYRRAVQYLEQAAQNAIRRNAYREAIGHLTLALKLLNTLPDTPDRAQQELSLQTALGATHMALKGYASPEVDKAYTRARQLCQQEGGSPQLFPTLRGQWVFYLLRAELQTTHELGEQLLTLAQSVQDPALLLEAHFTLGVSLFFLGEPARARPHLEQCITLYDLQRHGSHAFLYGQDPGVFAHIAAALALWVLGYADQALERIHGASLLAQEVSHQFSLAGALVFVGWIHHFRREGHETQEQAQAAIRLSDEQGFPFWMAWGTILWGWALAEEEEGIAQMRQGLSGLQATGAELVRPYIVTKLAEAYGAVGQPKEGLTLLAEALPVAYKTGERWSEAEVYRLKGTLTLEARGWRLETSPSSPQASSLKPQVSEEVLREAEGYFLKAIEIARHQQAKSWELRASTSLARLWQSQGKIKEAHKLLAEIYGWFTEGFDTVDLKEAKALLVELSQLDRPLSGGKWRTA